MLLVLLIGLSCAVATDTSKDISELEVKKQDIDTNINALKESNVDKTVNQKEIIGKTQNTQIDKIKAKETTKNTITKKEPTISSTEKSTKTTDDDTQEASNHDAKSNKKSNTDSSTLVPLEDHEEVSYDKNTVSNEVNINPKVTNNIKDSTFNLKNIEEPYKNVSSLNQINTNGTFNLTSDTSGQLTLSDGNTTIYGNNHKIIPNNPNQYFVTINAGQKLTLKNIVIDSNPGFFSDWLYRPAIIVNAGGELILDNCTISKTIQAIKSEGNVTILNSNINNNGRIAHGATIEINGNSNVYIENSRLSNNQYCGINVASNQAKVLLNQTALSGSIEMHVYLGNISLYNVTYDGTQITDENKVSNNGIQDTQDKTNKKNIIILEDSMISIDHAQKILNSTTMTINGRLTSGNTYLPNQTLKVYVDDVLIGEVTTNDNGYYTISYTAEEVGNHNIKVTYDGNYKYLPSEAKSSFEVYKIDTNIIINNINDELFDKLANITGTLTNANDEVISNAKVIVTINGNQKILITNSTGGFTYTGAKVLLGDNTVTALFEGTRTYNPSEDTKTFTGKKHDTQITLNPIENTHIDDSIEISGILTDVNGTVLTNKNIIITIDNQQHTITTDDNGKYRITHTITSSGEKTVLVTYDGDTAYNPSSNQTSFNVRRINTNLSIDTIDDTTIESDITISGILKDEFGNLLANKEIIITINGQEYTTTTDNDGKYNYKYKTEMTGLHNIEVIYAGDTTYFPSNNKTTFNVRKINTNISINNINDTTIGQEIEISGVLTDEFGNNIPNATIKIIVNGNQQNTTITDTEGNYKVIIKNTLGLNTVFVIYDGNYKYYPSNNQTSFNTTTNTMISINNIDDTTIGSSININGTLKDGEGNTLSNTNLIITINGQKYTVITDNDGKYNYIYTTSTLGENIVEVAFTGNTTHKSSNNQTSFNVRKINTTISLDNISDKTIDSTIWISGILKDEFGNILPNTQVSILINTHNITTTTDVNGKYNYSYTTTTLGENRIMVGYIGNDKYSSSYNETSFNVHRINTNLSIDTIDDTTIGSDITIKGVLRDEFGILLADKEIIITINGQEYVINTNADGKYNYIYTTSTLGENIVSVNYPGNNKYSPSSNQTSFNVRKINTNLSIDTIDDTTIESDITISGILKDEFGNLLANKEIIITINGQEYTTTTDNDGKYNYIYKTEMTGLHNIEVIYAGDTTYFPSNNKTTFNVRKINTNLSINDVNDTTIGQEIEISGVLTDEFGNNVPNATIKIIVNGNQQNTTITDAEGNYKVIIKNTLGLNTVFVIYDGNYKYYPSNNQTSFNTTTNTMISINNIDDTTIGSIINIDGTLKDGEGNTLSNTNLIITINGQEYTVITDNDGKYNYIYTTSTLGENIVGVAFTGNTTHKPSNNQTSFNVRKINTNLSINDIDNTTIGRDITISGVLTDEFRNTLPNTSIVIIINGQEYTTTTDDDGKYNYIYTTSTLGENIVNVNYPGDNKYSPSSNQTSFNVRKINTNLSIDTIDDTTIESDITISGVLTDEFGNLLANKEIIITINGQEYTTTTDNDGKYNYTYMVNTLDQNTVIVNYLGDNKYSSSNNQTSFNVRKINTNLSINDVNDTTIGQEIEISGVLTDEFGNTLSNTSIVIIINGQEYTTTTDNEGKYNYIYTTSTLGENIVSVNYPGNNKYSSSSNQTSFNVRKINTNLSIDIIDDTTIESDITISGVLTDEFGNTLSNTSIVIIINGQEYTTTTDNDGKYNYIYTTSTLDENIVSVNYLGNNKYSPSSNQTSFNVRKINTNLSIDTIDDTTVGRDITVSGVLTDEFGNILANTNITIIVNGNIFKATTDVNGVYNYGYTIDVTGLHRVDVIYSGNTTHFPSNNNTSFNVRKIDTNLSINTINDTTISSNVEVSGTLTDEYENILPNTTITININGQEYTTTTDNNGKYNYTYMVNTLDQNTVIVNYPGDDKYNSATTFTTFNVRKINTKLFINTINDTIVGQDINVGGVLKDEFENILVNTTVEITITNPKGTKNTYTTTTNEEGMYSVTYAGNIDGTYKVEVNYIGNNTYNSSSNETSFNTRKINTKLIIDSIENTTIDTNIFITGKLVDEFGNIVPNTFINITVNNNMIELYVDANGTFTCIYKTSILGENNITLQYNGNDTYNPSSNEASFNVRKLKSTIVVDSIVGYIGENITLTARITDENGKLVNGGNIVFKFNGKTLREDGRFDSTASPMKFKVVDGIVKYITVADAYLRNVKHITATYSGSYNYESSKAEYNHVLLNKRSAQINVTVTPNFTKQNTKILFNATIKDVTINGTNTSIINNNGKVIFKINGKVVKDEDGNIIFVKVVNNSANYTYYIPNGMASVYNNSVLRNYTVEAVYGNPLYDSDTRNITIFNVEQSPININVANITINKNTNKLTLKANITDYQENLVVGTNKICLKINDKTLTDESNNTIYYYITDGIIDLSNITVPAINNYHNITIVAGERYAYKSNKITSTDINVVDK